MVDQVNIIESSVTKLSDGIASVKASNDKTVGDLTGLVNNLDLNVNQVNEGLTSIRTQINAVSQQLTSQASSEALAQPEDLLRAATVDRLAGNYDLAVEGYREFLMKYPNDPRAAMVQYEIGDAYYNDKKFEQAVIEYDLFLQKYTNDDRTRSALYKKGLAHAELNQNPLALAALQRVVKEYPNTTEATNAGLKIKELNAPRRAR
jgi:tol-pal system protein YbgF